MKRSITFVCGLMLMHLAAHGVSQSQGQQAASVSAVKAVVATPVEGTTRLAPEAIPSAVPFQYETSKEVIDALKQMEVAPGADGGIPIEAPVVKEEEEKGLPPSLGTNFEGISYTGWRPPDCAVAVGANHVVEVVNSSWVIYNKNGTQASAQQTLSNWFAGVSPPGFIFDPKVVYDPAAGRFIMLALGQDANTQVSVYLFAVSQSSNAMGGWWLYKQNARLDGSNNTSNWADFPGLGYDAQAVYFTSNQYAFGGGFQYAKMRILNKAVLYSGGGLGWYDFWNWSNSDGTKVFTWKPAQTYGGAPAEYLVNTRSGGGTSVTLWAVTNPLGTPGLSRQATITIGAYGPPPNACQLGGANLIATGDCRTQDVAWRGGYLYTAFSQAYNPGSGNGSALRILKINTGTSSSAQNWIYYQSGAHFYYPAATVNYAGVMYVAFNRSSCASYVSANAVTEVWLDPNYRVIKSGEGYYGQDRWGDYTGISPDPAGPVWVAAEYAKNSTVAWGTWLGWLIPNTPPVLVTVKTEPAGRSFSVDGTLYSTAQIFAWTPGSAHAVGTTTPQVVGLTRYLFWNWSDAGSISHIVTPTVNALYQANFTAQHYLTMTAGPGGVVSPPSNWYNGGQLVSISATPNSGNAFAGWTGSGPGSYTGSANPVNVTMNGPLTETAAFTGATNIVLNPGFESGTAPWSFFTNGVGTFTTVSPGAVGAKAAKVALTTAGDNTQLSQWNLHLEANKAYRLRFRAYSNTGHDLAVCLHKHTAPYQSYGLFDYRVNLTTAWQAFSVTFVTGGFAGTVSDARLRFWMGPYVYNGDQYFIDDVILEKVASVPGLAPTIVVQPIPDTVVVGGQAWFNITAFGTPPLAFQWRRNGVNIAGATSPTYQKSNITLADNGALFTCRVSNAFGSPISIAAPLRVNTNVLRNNGFELGTYAWSLEKTAPSAGSFTTVTPGAVGTKAAKVTITTVGSNIYLKQAGFPFVSTGQYRLTFRAKSSTGRDMTVGVQKDASPFTCYGLMGHRVNLTTAWATYSVTFNANGFAGTVLDGRLIFFFANDAAASQIYYIDDVVLNYQTPPVVGVPRVTTQPLSQAALVGQRPTFTVVATGTGPLTYQWQKRGVDIVGATAASYKIPAATLADNGAQYRCQVRNALGVSSSNHATLTVTLLQAKADGDGETAGEIVPQAYALRQNYPNPFNPSTTVAFDLPEQARVTVRIFNVLGEEVALLQQGVLEAGQHQAVFNATDHPSGVYFCRLEAVGLGEKGEKFQQFIKMMLLK
jgi:hypothetical protein